MSEASRYVGAWELTAGHTLLGPIHLEVLGLIRFVDLEALRQVSLCLLWEALSFKINGVVEDKSLSMREEESR